MIVLKATNIFANLEECALMTSWTALAYVVTLKRSKAHRKWGIWCAETEKEGENSSRQQYPPTSSLPRVRMWVGNCGGRQNVGPRYFAAVCEMMQCCPWRSPLLGVCCGWPQWVSARSVNEDMMKHDVSSASQQTYACAPNYIEYIRINSAQIRW